MKRRERRNLYLSILSVFLLLTIFAGSAFALSGDGTNIRHTGGGSAVSGDYLVPTSSSDHLVGYRFTWLTKDTSGNYASKSALDVFYKGYNPNSSWGYHIKATVSGNTYRNLSKYEYKRWFDTVTIDREYYTNSSYKYCSRTDIPVTLPADEAAMTTWGKVDANINTILNKMIPGSTVANMKAEDFVFIEPIYRVKIEGTNYCITVTEMGLIGCVVCSNTSTGNEGAGYGSGWVTIRRYTNFNWPDALKTTATHAGIAKGTALSSSSYATFENMVKKGFGLMAVWNSSPHVLTVYYQTGTGHSSLKISSNYKLASDFTSYSSSYIRTTSNGYFTQTVNYDNSLTLMQGNSSGFNLTRDYYTFSKWQLSGSSSKFNGGASVRASALNSAVSTSNQSATLVAVWAPINYTITYNLNGGKIGNSSVNPTQTYNYETDVYIGNYTTGGTAYTVPSKTGYTFVGWKYTGNTVGYWTKDNVYPNQYHKGVSEHGNITLTAQWTPITYTVSYNANGGSGAPSSQTKTYGVNLTLSSTKPTRTGYTFSGWNTNSGGTGTSYSAGGTYTGNANLTLYAKWTPITYTVSYNANGGSGAPGNQTKTYGVDLTLSSTKPTRTGYTFVSWNTKADGTGTTYASGGIYTGNAALTLYAKWTPITYTVSYNANGGSGAPGNQTKTYGVDLTLSSTKPTRTGYTFVSWNTKADGTGTTYVSGGKYTGNAALTLYAVWTPITYTVSYNANGGSGAPGNQTKTYGVDLTLSSVKPSRTGYNFKEWNTKADGTGTSYPSGGKYTGNAALLLYAIWTPKTYTVIYNANGGIGAPMMQVKTYGKDLTLSTQKPTRTGYTFVAWNTVANGTGRTYTPGQIYSDNSSVTLYAQWKTAYELRIEPIVPNAPYRCGTEVVTGFYLVNSGSAEVTPSQNVSVRIQISNGSNVIKNSTVSAVVPGNEKNLYYVKWQVPNGIGSVTAVANVIIEGSVTSTVSRTYSTCPNEIYSTPDTQYEASAPDGFTAPDVPGEYSQIKTWYVWSYQNNSFRRTNYGISIGDAKPAVTPDASANAVFSSGIWTMKSGYGFGLQMNNGVAPVSGYSMPDYGAYTLPQYAVALFPEFYYLTGQGKCRTLELNGNTWNFRQNATYGKIHFTPLWYPDGNYTAVVNQSDCWTPLGMISRQMKANTVIISGSAYDDWTIR